MFISDLIIQLFSVPVLHKLQSTVQISNKIGNNECEACQKVNGKCYDQNNDGIADGCQCLPDRSFVLKSDKHENSRNKVKSMSLFRYKNERFSCETEHIKTDCSEEKLTVCYLPHTSGRFKTLTYHLQRNLSYVSLIQSTHTDRFDGMESCLLKLSSSSTRGEITTLNNKISLPFKNSWLCITILNDESRMSRCQVKAYSNPICNKINNTRNWQYSGYVYIRQVNKIHLYDKTLLEIPWLCTTKTVCNVQSKPTDKLVRKRYEYDFEQLYVLNSDNEIVTEAFEDELVHLELISKYKESIISIEMCATASLKHSESLNSNTSIHLLLRQAFYRFKCDVKHERTVASYHNDTIFVRDLSRGNQSTSNSASQQNDNFFPYQVIPQQNVVYYICLTPSLSESITYNLGKNLLQNWCHLSRERTGLISVNHLSIARLTVRNPISPHQCRFPYE
ncbi:unnamed protein product [Heterobilharzia americana]|nr:unnamed protein product [Heterobilharzia americana]